MSKGTGVTPLNSAVHKAAREKEDLRVGSVVVDAIRDGEIRIQPYQENNSASRKRYASKALSRQRQAEQRHDSAMFFESAELWRQAGDDARALECADKGNGCL